MKEIESETIEQLRKLITDYLESKLTLQKFRIAFDDLYYQSEIKDVTLLVC